MTREHRKPASRSWPAQEGAESEKGFERHGPQPPENDSGPSPSIEELDRHSDFSIHNVDGDEQVD